MRFKTSRKQNADTGFLVCGYKDTKDASEIAMDLYEKAKDKTKGGYIEVVDFKRVD